MNILKIIYFAELVILFLKTLDFIYLFQTKEYRFDRFISFLKEENFIYTFVLRKIRKPAISIRNVLILTLCVILASIILPLRPTLSIIIIFPMILPLISLVLVTASVLTTSPFAYFRRRQIISAAKRKITSSNTVFIGITGSYGKTTTKEFLYQILKTKFRVAKTDENMNSDVGVAISILKNLQKETQFFIAEMGAYRVGEIKAICDLVHPKYGILTAIGNQHLDLFASKENLVRAKSELLESLPKDGKAYINRNIDKLEKLLEKLSCKYVLFSADQKNNLTFRFPFIGRHYILNVLPCIALAQDLGIPKEKIIEAVAKLKPAGKRLALKKGINNAQILDDSYSSNVEGFVAGIETSQELNKARTVIMTRGIIELGKEKKNSYNKILHSLSKTSIQLYTTDALFKQLDENNQVTYFPSENLLVEKIKGELTQDVLLLIEGKFNPNSIRSLFHI